MCYLAIFIHLTIIILYNLYLYETILKKERYEQIYSGNAVLKVNVPAFKFEKAHEYDKMYEEAFEMGERSFDDQFKKNSKKLKPK